MRLSTFPITLEDSYMLSPKVKHFIFKCFNTPIFDYQPGQFITIHFEREGQTFRRSYSIANAPYQDNRIEFAAGFVDKGPGTDLLFNLKPKDNIQINGPFGRLTLKDNTPQRYILVATSTGITPYRAMLNELKTRLLANPSLHVIILQGVQKREDVLYKDEFLALSNHFPRVIFRAHLSREPSTDIAAHEYSGHVQASFKDFNLNPEEDVVYLCGNPGMIDDSFSYLKDKGFSTQQIIREKYISN